MMILEISTADIKSGHGAAFEQAFTNACSMISALQGFYGAELHKSIDRANRYYMFVTWKTLEDHTIGFARSEIAVEAMKLVLPHFDGMPRADHVIRI